MGNTEIRPLKKIGGPCYLGDKGICDAFKIQAEYNIIWADCLSGAYHEKIGGDEIPFNKLGANLQKLEPGERKSIVKEALRRYNEETGAKRGVLEVDCKLMSDEYPILTEQRNSIGENLGEIIDLKGNFRVKTKIDTNPIIPRFHIESAKCPVYRWLSWL